MIKRVAKFTVNIESHYSNILPTPINISNIWNFGSCLGLFLAIQVFTGLFLARHYRAHTLLAFDSIVSLSRETSYGEFLRTVHLNGASLYFLFLYLHLSRGLYYGSYAYSRTWFSGFLIMILSIIVAFLGYVLPWGQISYWGATVITNLISALPVVGSQVVRWIWGGFRLSNATLSRFFMLHFCIPIMLLALVFIHLYFLHNNGRQNPTNISSKYNLLSFHHYFTLKDIYYFFVVFFLFERLIFLSPYFLGDPENFSMADMMSTPEHIVPEWYFLFAYAILRSIPRKGLGVVRILLAVTIILAPILSMISKRSRSTRLGKGYYPITQAVLWSFFSCVILLTWLGGQIVEAPFVLISQIIFIIYLVNWIFLSLNQ